MHARPELDPLDARLLSALQEGLALVQEPFFELAARAGTTEGLALERVRVLAGEARLIRQISPIYDTRRCGYDSALVAFEVADAALEHAAAVVGAHPGVSHSYQRSHALNLWFTLAVAPDSALGLERTVEALVKEARAARSAVLRAKRTFKLGVKLALEADAGPAEDPAPARAREPGEAGAALLTPRERQVIALTQGHLPLEPRPFEPWARALGLTEAGLLVTLRELLARGVMRRFAAILHHRRAGFVANGMAVWEAGEDQVEAAGLAMAAFAAVSHCYERALAPGWPYRLFSMIHGRSREEVEATVAAIRARTGLARHLVLYSTREFKKRRVELFPSALHAWEHGRAA